MRIPELNTTSKSACLTAFVMVVVAGCGSRESLRAGKLGVNALVEDPGFEDGSPRELTGRTRPWVGEEPGEVFIVNDGTAHTGAQHAIMLGANGQLMQMVGLSPIPATV